MPALFVEILLDQNLTKRLDYSVPEKWKAQVQVGMRVEAPLKNQLKKGTIAAIKTESSVRNVRPIERLLSDAVALTDMQWKLASWISHYYAAPLQRVLKCFIPPHVRQEVEEQKQWFLSLSVTHAEGLKACELLRSENPQEAIALEEILKQKKGCFAAALAQTAGVPRRAIEGLVKKGILSARKAPTSSDLLLEAEFFLSKPKALNGEQQACLEAIQKALAEKRFSAHLIHGVTGSGKTEVYLAAIERTLEQQRGAILLVPEVSLTSQTIERFRSRFSEKIAVLHHRRSLGERNRSWGLLQRGEIRIAIGARSAIFAPMPNLGLIIVDEEHDSSYKQSDETPCYHARNVAVMRAHLEDALVILGSATPSIESRYNAEIGKYRLHTLSSRATAASLPSVRIVDMKRAFEMQGGFTHFSSDLLDGIKKRLQLGEQTLLFLNRRGYHRLQICSACRTIAVCPHCDLGLTFHREANLLRCHLCGYQKPRTGRCDACGASGSIEFKGFGTEHVERSLHAIFPEIRTLRMDRDTTRGKNSHEDLFKQFRAHKADVLIGTQMVAKGFHFPAVTLVGVLNPDATLSIPDFRSSEFLFQLLTQVAGRAGRAELPGEVILQTFLPDHPVLKLAAAQNYNAFYKEEIEERRLFAYPPFVHLVKCLFAASDPETARLAAEIAHAHVSASLPACANALPPTPAGHPKVKDLYRMQFLIKTSRIDILTPILASIPASNAQSKIDVDPLSTFF